MNLRTWVWPLIQYHREEDALWADSPQVPGWIAAADTDEELYALVDEAREAIFRPSFGWPKVTNEEVGLR